MDTTKKEMMDALNDVQRHASAAWTAIAQDDKAIAEWNLNELGKLLDLFRAQGAIGAASEGDGQMVLLGSVSAWADGYCTWCNVPPKK